MYYIHANVKFEIKDACAPCQISTSREDQADAAGECLHGVYPSTHCRGAVSWRMRNQNDLRIH